MFTVCSTLIWAVLTGPTDWVCHIGTLNTVRRGGCLELYYCNMVEWFWWDSSLISMTNWFPSVLWHCWFGHLACKNRPKNYLLCVEWDVKPCTLTHFCVILWLHVKYVKYNYFEIILKSFQCFTSHVKTSENEMKLFQLLKLFQNYFSDIERVGKYSWAAISLQKNFWNNFGQNYSRWTSTKAELILK